MNKKDVWDSPFYPPKSINVLYCPFCGSNEVTSYTHMGDIGCRYYCMKCSKVFRVEVVAE